MRSETSIRTHPSRPPEAKAVSRVASGMWYLSVGCHTPGCERDIPFVEAPSLPIDIDLPDMIQVCCPTCGQEGTWTSDEVGQCRGWQLR
jgi:hypothetical protein